MSDTLLMPEHVVQSPNKDGRDFYLNQKGVVCRASRVPGYTLQQPDGRLHCNRCGWVTPEPVVTAYSTTTGNSYLTWEALVEAEANGYAVVSTSTRPGTVPAVNGPYPTKADAKKAAARLRRKGQREEAPHRVRTFVRVLWP